MQDMGDRSLQDEAFQQKDRVILYEKVLDILFRLQIEGSKDFNTEWSFDPVLAVENNKIYVVWVDKNDTNSAGTDEDIFYRCNITGASWEPVQVISEYGPLNTANIRWSGNPSIAVENGIIYVVWQDESYVNGAGSDSDIFSER